MTNAASIAQVPSTSSRVLHLQLLRQPTAAFATMAEPERDLEKLSKEQAKEDAAFLDNLEKESKEFDKVRLKQ